MQSTLPTEHSVNLLYIYSKKRFLRHIGETSFFISLFYRLIASLHAIHPERASLSSG